MKVSLIHLKIHSSLNENLNAAREGIKKAAKNRPQFIALPEYFSVPNAMAEFKNAAKISQETCQTTLKMLSEVSKEFPDIYILGGTVLEEEKGKYYNTSTLWRNGEKLCKYHKRNPIAVEVEAGVSKGDIPVVFKTEHCILGMIVCADSFNPSTVKDIVDLGAEFVYLPVAAMGTHPIVKGHPLTEKIAVQNGVYITKVGNVSSSARGGRSAFITPWGIDQEVTDAIEDSIITTNFDMQKLRDYRSKLKKTNY
ncbi:MAG: carbon-nitrogen hydrolase family protein [Crenarchaeota archaeon]|nr:carbon-nitrogen hydrolase family protein [Thermoproteota archaeon]